MTLVADQQVIPAAMGVMFGVKVGVDADIPAASFTILHPPMGSAGQTRQGWPVFYESGVASGQYWLFEQEFELVPGDWTFTVHTDSGETIYEVEFTVVEQAAYTGVIPDCIADLLS